MRQSFRSLLRISSMIRRNKVKTLTDIALYDFHSHLLPNVDDGSASVEESIKMLSESYEQGIRHIVATPHFYANFQDLAKFIERREKSVDLLQSALGDVKVPKIHLGAEVAYFNGIGRSDKLAPLCIDGTNLMLLEMPFEIWSESVVDDVIRLSENSEIVPILAHIERYAARKNMGHLPELARHGILVQSNSSFFLDKLYGRKAFNLLKNDTIQLLGSDTHNCTTRPQTLGFAASAIAARDEQLIKDVAELSEELLKDSKTIN